MQDVLLVAASASIVLVVLALYKSLISVSPGETKAIYVLGQFKGTLSEGYHIVYPFITGSKPINTKIRGIEIPRQTVLSSDDKQVSISVTVYVRVSDVETFVETVDNLDDKILTIGKSQIKTVIGEYESTHISSNRREITQAITDEISDAVDSWGVEIERVEVTNFNLSRVESPSSTDE